VRPTGAWSPFLPPLLRPRLLRGAACRRAGRRPSVSRPLAEGDSLLVEETVEDSGRRSAPECRDGELPINRAGAPTVEQGTADGRSSRVGVSTVPERGNAGSGSQGGADDLEPLEASRVALGTMDWSAKPGRGLHWPKRHLAGSRAEAASHRPGCGCPPAVQQGPAFKLPNWVGASTGWCCQGSRGGTPACRIPLRSQGHREIRRRDRRSGCRQALGRRRTRHAARSAPDESHFIV
jgi:hypothetical protein